MVLKAFSILNATLCSTALAGVLNAIAAGVGTMHWTHIFAVIGICFPTKALAIVGNASPASSEISRHIVLITSSRGGFCTGALIAPQIVLTAGHCIHAGDIYKLIKFGPGGVPIFFDVSSTVRHPQFDMNAYLNHRATADVAILTLTKPLGSEFAPARLASEAKRASAGDRILIAGFGASVRGDGSTGGKLRAANLIVTGQPGTLQIRLMDPVTRNQRGGLGACTGDSGAPAFDENNALVGLVSWTTAPGNEDGCGGLSGVTPLARYLSWIKEMANKTGTPLHLSR